MKDPIKPYKRQNGETYYYFKAYVGINEATGKKIETTRRGFKSRAAAKLAMSRLIAQVDKMGQNKPPRYEEMYHRWHEGYKTTVKESTLNRVEGIFKHHVIPALGKYYINKITPDMAQKIANNWSKELVDFRKVLAYAALPLKLAERRGIIQRNPFDLIERPKKGKISDKEGFENFWDRQQLKVFFEQLDSQYGPAGSRPNPKAITFFRLIAFTGLRKGEILAMTWHDINFKKKTLSVERTVTRGLNNKMMVGTPKTKNSIRTLDLDAKTIALLKQWKIKQAEELLFYGITQGNATDQLVFQNAKNKLLSTTKPDKWLESVISHTSLSKITIHGFRHTFASLAFESGATIKQVQAQLGHSDVKTTLNIYTHVTKRSKQETINKFSSYVGF
ncbi:MAG: site-specific integrase [Lactobacillus sp.]|nr:site-specific integrase [Lactobacillus sp.]